MTSSITQRLRTGTGPVRRLQRVYRGRGLSGQTSVEYMLGIAVVAIAISVAFIYMSDSTRDIFNNARKMIELPYP